MTQVADLGLIGLAVMGQNLVLNMNDHGFVISVFNRTKSKIDDFLNGPAKGTKVLGSHSLEDFFKTLKRPRRVMFMVKAGEAVDDLIAQSLPFLEKGDIIIDGGNSNFVDTNRRTKELKDKGILFLGVGISGGEEGARFGPSIMPGGNPDAWPAVKPIFQAIAAKVNGNEPCCDWVGDDGAGHYVKMVHNGIEYGDMQLISESYDLLHRGCNLSYDQLGAIFSEWNKGILDSYLIDITSKIFQTKDTDNKPLVEKILDVAGQKGTGKWTVINALDVGIPLTLISEAVFARSLSSLYEQRSITAKVYAQPIKQIESDVKNFISDLENALYCAKITSYAQGFMLMREAAKEYKWRLNYGAIALMWRGGCIIRSAYLGKIKEAFDRNPELSSLFVDNYFSEKIKKSQDGWRRVVAQSAISGIPTPCLSSGLSFFDGLRSARLPANLIQAQRDFFGAHTYERVDTERGKFFHTQWI